MKLTQKWVGKIDVFIAINNSIKMKEETNFRNFMKNSKIRQRFISIFLNFLFENYRLKLP